jgi:hypothetical protein
MIDASSGLSPPTPQSFDAELPLLCQKIVGSLGQFLRQVARVKQLVRESEYMTEQPVLVVTLDVLINLVDNFKSIHGQICDEGMSRFEELSDASKLSVGTCLSL